ncbi:MAG: 7-cyano-7-deazaguanine synthase QueC, partial [Armatimonadota bacterium]
MSAKAVCLLSGGIDSSTAAAVARSRGCEVYALTFDYGQRHRREIEAARAVAEFLRVVQHVVVSFDLRLWGGSALTAEIPLPEGRSPEERASEIPVTYVPARNTIFLAFALSYAEAVGAESIYIGANQIDYSGYPDCRGEYLRAFERVANLGTKAGVEGRMTFRIEAPLLNLKKSEIIRLGVSLGLDYGLTW